jgi:hypothetical protein
MHGILSRPGETRPGNGRGPYVHSRISVSVGWDETYDRPQGMSDTPPTPPGATRIFIHIPSRTFQ